MADERASLRKPAALPRRPVVALKAQPVAAAARSPLPAARSLQQRIGNRGTQALAAGVVARSTAPVSDPKNGSLLNTHWQMEFVAVIAAIVDDNLLPVKSVVWRLEDDHARDSSGALNPVKFDAKADPALNGAPPDLGIDKAMAGRTCRFMARRMSTFCKPELT